MFTAVGIYGGEFGIAISIIYFTVDTALAEKDVYGNVTKGGWEVVGSNVVKIVKDFGVGVSHFADEVDSVLSPSNLLHY